MKPASEVIAETVKIFEIPASRKGFSEAIQWLLRQSKQELGAAVYFVNVHTVTESRWNPTLRESLQRSTINFADGLPLVWFSKVLGDPIRSRVCGPDFMSEVLRNHREGPMGLIGGMPGVAEKVSKNFHREDLCRSPPMRPMTRENVRDDLENLRNRCGDRKLPKIIWIGLGAPKQENWIRVARELEPSVIFLGVGAAFDFLAKSKSRAPLWLQNLGLEWLFRLSQEPRRLMKRYFVTNSVFVFLAICEGLRRQLKKALS